MSKWLASVQSLEEARVLLSVLPDILDMKNPAEGALGALKVDTVGQIVKLINGRCQTSATIGDLPMQSDLISTAMINMASSGVDYIKIGLFPETGLSECIVGLAATINNLKIPVIGVLFADKALDSNYLPLLKASGFKGVMVDTAIKNGQHLLDHWSFDQLADFVESACQQEMLCGLAGALRCEDIPALSSMGADYLGFRSALCQRQQRTSSLQIALAKQIQQAIYAQKKEDMSSEEKMVLSWQI